MIIKNKLANLSFLSVLVLTLLLTPSIVFAVDDSTPIPLNNQLFSAQSVAPEVEDATGALVQQIPLEIPLGRNGLTPELNLSYNSNNLVEDNIAGYGWELSIPYIERVNKVGSEQLYTAGYFRSSMGGELATTSTSGRYRNRIDDGSFLDYTYDDGKWFVYDKSGTKYTFGTTSASQIATTGPTMIFRWMLDEVRDINDNYITYTYTKDQGQVYISNITYTGNGSTDGIFDVDFTYETRPDPITSYKSNFEVVTAKRLTQVLASVDDSWVRKYVLSYTSGVNGSRSLLSSVQETGRDADLNTLALPEVSFAYSSTTPTYESHTNLWVRNGSYLVGDGNGDGLPDLHTMYQDILGCGSNARREISENTYPGLSVLTGCTSGNPYWAIDNATWDDFYIAAENGVRFFDINGDGLTDIIQAKKQTVTGGGAVYTVGYYPNSGNFSWSDNTQSTTTIPIFLYIDSDYDPDYYSTGLLGNINGDGLTDYVLSISSGDFTEGAYLKAPTTTPGWVVDTEIFDPIAQMPTDRVTQQADQLVDINGDGLDDWMHADSGSINFYLNTGTGWKDSPTPWNIGTSTRHANGWDRGIRFLDANGDGLADYVRAYTMPSYGNKGPGYTDIEVGTYNYVYLNTGSGFATSSLTMPGHFFTGVLSGSTWNGRINYGEYVDWNGDGILDSSGSTSTTTPGQTAKPDLLTRINYPTGGTTDVEYKFSAQLKTNPDLPYSILVVTKTTNNDGMGNEEVTTYEYENGNLYLDGDIIDRRPTFGVVTKTSPLNITKTYYNQGDSVNTAVGEQTDSYAQIGKPFRQDIISLASTTMQKTFSRWTTSDLGEDGGYFVYLDKQMTQLYDGDADHKDTAVEYAYATTTGNLLSKTEMGEVSGNSDGTYSDTGSDARFTEFTYESFSIGATTSTSTTSYQSTDLERGSNQYWSIADSSQTGLDFSGDMSLSLWIKPESLPPSGDRFALFHKWDDGVSTPKWSYMMYLHNNSGTYRIEYTIYRGTGGWNPSDITSVTFNLPSITTGSWQHLAVTKTGTTVKGYYDGTGLGSATLGFSNIANGNAPLRIGRGPCCEGTDEATRLDGLVDDARLWSRELSSTEVGDLHDDPMAFSNGSGLQGWWKFDGDGTDSSGNANTLTNNNSATFSLDIPSVMGTSTTSTTTSSGYNISFISSQVVKNNASTTVSQTNYYYDTEGEWGTKGNLTKQENWITGSTYASTTRTYDETYGLVTSETDGENNTTTYTYDSNYLYVATSTNPLSQATEYSYDLTTGKVVSVKDANNRTTYYTYDPVGRLTEKEIPDPSTGSTVTQSTITYTDNTFPTSRQETQYLNSATSTDAYTYFDGFGRVMQKRTESSNSFVAQDVVYGDNGLLYKESLPYFSSGTARTTATTSSDILSVYAYDSLGRVTSVTNSLGAETHAYDQWVETVTDREGNTKSYTKDAYGLLVQVDEDNVLETYITEYEYDALGNLTKITDALDNVRNFVYDGLSRLTDSEDLHAVADGTYGEWSYEYDYSSNLTSRSDPKSQTVNWTYDNLNRVLTEDYTGSAGTEVEYEYDTCVNGVGRLCVATTTDSVSSFVYNPLGLQSSESKTIDGTSYVTAYTYDRIGNQIDVTYPDDSIVRYEYDSAGLLDKVSRKAANLSAFYVAVKELDYAPTGAVIKKVFANGVESNYTYDPAQLYRLTRIYTTATTTSGVEGPLALLGGAGIDLRHYASTLPSVYQKITLAGNDWTALSLLDEQEVKVVEELPDIKEEEIPEVATTTEEVFIEEIVEEEVVINENATTTSETIPGPEVVEEDNLLEEVEEVPTDTREGSDDSENATSTPQSTPDSSGEIELIDVDQESATTTEPLDDKDDLKISDKEAFTEIDVVTASTTDALAASSTPKIKQYKKLLSITSPKSGSIRSTIEKMGTYKRTIEKSKEVAKKIKPVKEKRDKYTIEIVSIESIEGGVQAFVRVWDKKGKQIGFGPDGTVDMERFRVFNPPILVPDKKGDVIQEIAKVDIVTGEETIETLSYREDPTEALMQVIEHNLSVMRNIHGPDRIIENKKGTTVSTFYSAAGQATPVDGMSYWWGGASWGAARGAAATYVCDTCTGGEVGIRINSTTVQNVVRNIFGFDTSAIDDNEISSATFSVTMHTGEDTGTNPEDFKIIVDEHNGPVNSDSLSTTDHGYDKWSGVKQSDTEIPITDVDTRQYYDYALNSTGLANINSSGNTWLGLRIGFDLTNTDPGTRTHKSYNAETVFADTSGTTEDPKLVVEHTPPAEEPYPGDSIQDIRYSYDNIGNITYLAENATTTSLTRKIEYTYDELSRLLLASSTATSSLSFIEGYDYNEIGNFIYKDTDGPDSIKQSTDLERNDNQYWSISDSAQTGLDFSDDMSLSIWIKPESLPPSGDRFALFHKWDDTVSYPRQSYFMYLYNDSGTYKIEFAIYRGTGAWNPSDITSVTFNLSSITTGTWQHLALTKNGATVKGYYDGTSLGSATLGFSNITNSNAPFRIGRQWCCDDSNQATRLDGLVDDARVWSRELSSTEIGDLYDDPLAFTNGSDLEGWWKFDGDGTDSSGNTNILTNNNGATFSLDVPGVMGESSTSTQQLYGYTTTGYINPHAPLTFFDGTATTTYTYDNNGNLTGDGTNTYTWDYRNRMATFSDGSTTAYGYDHTDARVYKTSASATTTYPNRYYSVENNGSVATTTSYIFLPDGTPIAMVEGNGNATTTSYIHPDHLGSTNVLTDEFGEVSQTLDYYPYGGVRIDNTNSVDNDNKYTGHKYDRESDLTYAGARYLDNSRGQWVSMDPASRDNPRQFLLDPQQLNMYSYARNNPLVLFDPTGEKVEAVARAIEGYSIGTHVFLLITPDSPGDFGLDSGLSWTVGGYTADGSTLTKGISDLGDVSVIQKGYSKPEDKSGALKARVDVQRPDGISDTEFINRIMGNYNAYGDDAQYDAFARDGYNSNNFVSGLLLNSGVERLPWNGNSPGIDPGFGQGIPDNYVKANGQALSQGPSAISGYAKYQGIQSSARAVQGALNAVAGTLGKILGSLKSK